MVQTFNVVVHASNSEGPEEKLTLTVGINQRHIGWQRVLSHGLSNFVLRSTARAKLTMLHVTLDAYILFSKLMAWQFHGSLLMFWSKNGAYYTPMTLRSYTNTNSVPRISESVTLSQNRRIKIQCGTNPSIPTLFWLSKKGIGYQCPDWSKFNTVERK